jgi:hypothetical protein
MKPKITNEILWELAEENIQTIQTFLWAGVYGVLKIEGTPETRANLLISEFKGKMGYLKIVQWAESAKNYYLGGGK